MIMKINKWNNNKWIININNENNEIMKMYNENEIMIMK